MDGFCQKPNLGAGCEGVNVVNRFIFWKPKKKLFQFFILVLGGTNMVPTKISQR
jgi:hypothetical protein